MWAFHCSTSLFWGHAVQEGLGGLCRIGLHKAAVAVGQVQHQVVHLPLHTSDDRYRLAEIALGVAWWVGQGLHYEVGILGTGFTAVDGGFGTPLSGQTAHTLVDRFVKA